MQGSVIETHPKRDAINDALLAGQSLRKVASLAGVSHMAIRDYKAKVLIPSLMTAAKAKKIQAMAEIAESGGGNAAEVLEMTRAVASAANNAPWFDRHEKLWQLNLEALEDSKRARKIINTTEGQVIDGKDFSAFNATLANAYKAQEQFGKATGVLADKDQGNVTNNLLMVVMPRGGMPELQEVPAIDVEAIEG